MMFASLNSTLPIRRVSLEVQELLTPCSAPNFLVGFMFLNLQFSLYCYVDHCLSFCLLFSFGHCPLCPSMPSDYPFGIFKRWSQVVGLPSNSYKPITNTAWVTYKKGCTRPAATSDKVDQLLAHGRWFSPGTPASSTTKTGRHDIAEILLKQTTQWPKEKKQTTI